MPRVETVLCVLNILMVFQVQDFLGQCEDESVFRTSIMVLVNWNVSETDGRFWYRLGKLVTERERSFMSIRNSDWDACLGLKTSTQYIKVIPL